MNNLSKSWFYLIPSEYPIKKKHAIKKPKENDYAYHEHVKKPRIKAQMKKIVIWTLFYNSEDLKGRRKAKI